MVLKWWAPVKLCQQTAVAVLREKGAYTVGRLDEVPVAAPVAHLCSEETRPAFECPMVSAVVKVSVWGETSSAASYSASISASLDSTQPPPPLFLSNSSPEAARSISLSDGLKLEPTC